MAPDIPVVNLSAFSGASPPASRRTAARDLTSALRTHGFAAIVGHGVPEHTIDAAFRWAEKLFRLPHAEKMKAPHPASSTPHRGYSPVGMEKVYAKEDLGREDVEMSAGVVLEGVKDFKVRLLPPYVLVGLFGWEILLKLGGFSEGDVLRRRQESFEIGSEENASQPNIWLPEEVLPGFRAWMTEFYWQLDGVAKAILQATAQGLELDDEDTAHLRKLHSGHNNQLRLLHYPPISAEQLEKQIVVRIPPHADWR
jgi:isopenicillin N synthase-like dioxygenase